MTLPKGASSTVSGEGARARVFPSHPPWNRFTDFIESKSRFDALSALLRELGAPYSVARLGEGAQSASHIVISRAGAAGRQPVAFLAHYDSVPGSPGANDNAASVFILIEAALRLLEEGARGWFIIFTDKEELGSGESLRAQGAFLLARFFRARCSQAARFFIFDSCGCGDTLIISTMADLLLKHERGPGSIGIRKDLDALRNMAMEAAERAARDFLLLPTPFSDNAGFLRAGIAAQLITVLPAAEAREFGFLARKDPLYIHSLVSMDTKKNRDQSRFPETWRVINTPADGISRLNPEHFPHMVKFVTALCALGA